MNVYILICYWIDENNERLRNEKQLGNGEKVNKNEISIDNWLKPYCQNRQTQKSISASEISNFLFLHDSVGWSLVRFCDTSWGVNDGEMEISML